MGGLRKYWLVDAVVEMDGLRKYWLVDAVVEMDGLRKYWLVDAIGELGFFFVGADMVKPMSNGGPPEFSLSGTTSSSPRPGSP